MSVNIFVNLVCFLYNEVECRSGRDIQSLFSPLQMPTAILHWALDSPIFTVFIQLVKPKLHICAISTAVYLRSFLVAHLVTVYVSTQ